MKVTYENQTLTVDTEVSASLLEKGPIKATDEKDVVVLEVAKNEEPQIAKFGLYTNVVLENGDAAVVIVFPEGTTVGDVKDKYGDLLVHADVNIALAKTQAAMRKEAIDTVFEG